VRVLVRRSDENGKTATTPLDAPVGEALDWRLACPLVPSSKQVNRCWTTKQNSPAETEDAGRKLTKLRRTSLQRGQPQCGSSVHHLGSASGQAFNGSARETATEANFGPAECVWHPHHLRSLSPFTRFTTHRGHRQPTTPATPTRQDAGRDAQGALRYNANSPG
jgi:hypothetical protein